MDGPDLGPQEVADTFRFLEPVHRWLGGWQPMLSFFYVLASQFIHHFPDGEIPSVLKRLLAMCQQKLVINDLIRSPLAYSTTWLFTLLTSAVFRHDARISVRRGFTLGELERLLSDHAFHSFRLKRHFFYRFMLIVSKEASSL